MSKLILIRGLPGGGKSSIAKLLVNFDDSSIHIEADQYFMINNEYKFDISRIKEAHSWCQEETKKFLNHGYTVVVSNTFTTIKELKPYFDIAREFNIIPNVICAQNQFDNEHSVPEETLKRMKDRFIWDISELFNG